MDDKRKKVQIGMKSDKNIKPTVVDFPGFKGTLPFPVAKTVNAKATDKLPDEVRAEEKHYAEAPIVTPEHIKKTAAQPPAVVDFDDLPAAKKEEIKEVLANTLSTPKPTEQFMPSHPSIAAAMKMASKATKETQERMQQNYEKKPEPPKAKVKQPEPKVQEATKLPEEHTHISDTGATDVGEKCVHCGWERGKSDPTNPTSADKQNFVVSLLGQKRFTKQYELLGGKLSVVFRTLTVKENDDVIKQLVKDWNDGKISGPAHSVAEATKYQMVLGLDSVGTTVGLISLPEYEDYETMADQGGTILPSVVEYVYDNALKLEPMRRVVAKAYGHFIDTVSKLEAMAETPDFWLATGD